MGVLFVLLTNTSHMLLGWGCFSQADTRGARALAEIRKMAHCPHTYTHTLTHRVENIYKSTHDKLTLNVFCLVKMK